MHLHNTQILHLYIPWLCAALAGALELELVHRIRRLFFGVHPIPPGARWLLLIALGMAAAAGLSYSLIEFGHLVHIAPQGYELPWVVCLIYLSLVAERERRAARLAGGDLVKDSED
jgi:hypothetical protein